MTRYIRQSPLDKLNFDNELVVVVVDDGIGEPEKEESTAYTIRTPRNGNTDEIPTRSYLEIM
jgi:hypothetical protein